MWQLGKYQQASLSRYIIEAVLILLSLPTLGLASVHINTCYSSVLQQKGKRAHGLQK
jgi:hypothetical protein